MQVVGTRKGKPRGDVSDLTIDGGLIEVRGSLKGAKFNQVLKVTLLVGKPRGFGFLAPIHDVVEWEVVE